MAKETIPRSSFPEGLALCERNAERLFEKARKSFRRKEFLCAFILGFTAWEEFGKAALILEKWDEEFIGKKTWKKRFIKHKAKTDRAQYVSDRILLEEVSRQVDLDWKGQEIRLDDEYLRKLRDLRTQKALYVNYNFRDKIWESPIEVEDNLDSWVVNVLFAARRVHEALQIEKKRRGITA